MASIILFCGVVVQVAPSNLVFMGKIYFRGTTNFNLLPQWDLIYVSTMHIISRRTLRAFWQVHADSEQALRAWYQEAKAARWADTTDVKARYPSADFVAGNRVIFNIKGNSYRLILAFDYQRHLGWIKFIGTHAEYDRIDVATVEIG